MSTAVEIAAAYPKMASFVSDIVAVAGRLGIDPAWLANVINFESAGGNPQARNPTSGATGLIQFMPSTARKLGTTTAALAAMTGRQQMAWVERYFAPYKSRMKSQEDVFSAVFYPVAMGKGPGYTFPAKVQEQNPGIRTMGDYVRLATKRARLAAPTVARTATRWGAVALVVGSALVGAALLWRARKAKPLAPLRVP
jgi:hypothetical protein